MVALGKGVGDPPHTRHLGERVRRSREIVLGARRPHALGQVFGVDDLDVGDVRIDLLQAELRRPKRGALRLDSGRFRLERGSIQRKNDFVDVGTDALYLLSANQNVLAASDVVFDVPGGVPV
jgi:hypothetical protein